MSESTDWKNETYNTYFNQELLALQNRRERDPDCKVEDIEGVLRNLYINEGADWEGRGEVQKLFFAASIAAHEHFIAGWKAERRD